MQPFAFLAVLLFARYRLHYYSSTLSILLGFAILNTCANLLIIPGNDSVLIIYASIDLITVASILRAGDFGEMRQCFLLLLATIANLICQYDVVYETNFIYDDHEQAIGIITAFQVILGFWHGLVERKRVNHNAGNKWSMDYFKLGSPRYIKGQRP